MQAGWVSLGNSDSEFVLTPSGHKACNDSAGLPPTIVVADRQQTIVVEKVTGQVARSSEIDFFNRAKLKLLWEGGVALRKRDVSNVVDPGLIAPLLPHQPTEWIRWIGPISVLSDDAAFAVIDVDTVNNRITGIPKAWEAMLLPECIDQVYKKEQELAARGVEVQDEELRQFVRGMEEAADTEAVDSELVWTGVELGIADVLKSDADHRHALAELFSVAVTYVALAYPVLTPEMSYLVPLLGTALDKGLLVNMLFGEMPKKENPDSWRVFESLKKLEYDSARGQSSGRLVLGNHPTECCTSIALADSPSEVMAIVGNHQWSAGIGEESSLSIRIRDTWIVARLCEILGGFSASDEKLRLGSGFVRLKKAAGDLRRQAQNAILANSPPFTCELRLILGKDHMQAVSGTTTAARRTVKVFTSDLEGFSNSGLLALLADESERLGENIQIAYGAPAQLDGGRIPHLERLLKNGSILKFKPGLRTNLVVADADLAVLLGGGSYLPELGHRRLYSSRIGVVLRGTQIESLLLSGK